jgi:excinuclease ABC subunit C
VRSRLLQPVPAVEQALKLLPHEPGVYIFRNAAGRVIYIGRSRDLATRARSYWSDLGDRPHLRRMVGQVAWVEPVLCKSEHEAAFLESDLLERHRTRYNRTLGMESSVWLRLDADSRAPGLEVVHEPQVDDGAAWFGPYLGWEPARQAAAGLQRVYPLRFTGTQITRSERELARSLGVREADSACLAGRIDRVLSRDGSAVQIAVRGLEAMRDRAAAQLMFEHAASLQEQIRGLLWISQAQKLAGVQPVDQDYCGVAFAPSTTVVVVLSLRGGRMIQRHLHQAASLDAWRPALRNQERVSGPIEREWIEQAQLNAQLMAGLAGAGAVGPLGWHGLR